MQQTEDVLDRRDLSVFSLKPCCAQVMQAPHSLRSTQESFTRTSTSRDVSLACFLAVLLLWCPCSGCPWLRFIALCEAGVLAAPVPCSDEPAVYVRAQQTQHVLYNLAASPRQDRSAGLIHQGRAEQALGSPVGACCARGDVAGGRQGARAGWCCLEGYCTVALGVGWVRLMQAFNYVST